MKPEYKKFLFCVIGLFGMLGASLIAFSGEITGGLPWLFLAGLGIYWIRRKNLKLAVQKIKSK